MGITLINLSVHVHNIIYTCIMCVYRSILLFCHTEKGSKCTLTSVLNLIHRIEKNNFNVEKRTFSGKGLSHSIYKRYENS